MADDMLDTMRLIGLLLVVLTYSNCTTEFDSSVDVSRKLEKEFSKQRYRVHVADPPIVCAGATAMIGGDGNWPFIGLLKDNTLHIDLNAHHAINGGEILPKKGLGPTFKFKEISVSNDFPLIEKASVLAYAQGEQLIEDRFYGKSPQRIDFIEIDKESINCNLSISSGLKCRLRYSPGVEPGPFKTVWHSFDDPIVEVTRRSYSGLYAASKSGQLIFVTKEKAKLMQPKLLHANLKFVPNRHGRYFINAPSMDACMKTSQQEIYCAEVSALEPGSQIFGLTNDNQPLLSKVDTPSFEVEEVAFGGRHFCFLSTEGIVWCKGDNSCGQITGRHDGKQIIDKIEKITFLKNKAQQIFAHASGTCALLIDGTVQCWGLGASVIRTRILPDSEYNQSLSWVHGFRPWRVCEGGALNGL